LIFAHKSVRWRTRGKWGCESARKKPQEVPKWHWYAILVCGIQWCVAHRKTIRRSKKEQRAVLWATATLGAVALADQRLSVRAVRILARKASRPGDSIAQASRTSADAKAWYRFLENERVAAAELWEPIHHHTAKGLRGLACVVAVQDTTTLMLPGLKATTGLGTVDQPREEALLMHSALALGADGQPLGLLYNHVWARPLEEFGKGKDRKKHPIEEKESYEWILGVRQVTQLRDEHSPGTQLLHVFDRAGDVHEVLQEVVERGQECVIRSCQDRRVEGQGGTLRGTVASGRVLVRRTIEVPRKKGRPRRRARVELRSATVTLSPAPIYRQRKALTIHVVWVHEPQPPEGVEGLDWLLLTTLPVRTACQCLRVVATYKLRWRVEEFHLVLKSGCKMEKTQLKRAERIEIQLAFCCAVAARLLQVTYLARTEPTRSCTVVLTEDEWKVLCAYVRQEPIARAHSPPTIHEAVKMIGRLGGHLGRKCDGMPGVRSLWRGWRDLQVLVEGYHIAR